MKHLDLFSGIGGFSLAADMVWPDVEHSFVEIDPFCRAVLKKHWPNAKFHDDIKTFAGEPADLVTGGFPCQPFSAAGKRKGKADDRDLWPEMFRVIKASRPTWVIGENVANFIGMELKRSISDLEGEGYKVQPFDIPALSVDGRQIRHRLWIVAYREGAGARGLPIQPAQGRRSSEGPDAYRSGEDLANSHSLGRVAWSIQESGASEKEWARRTAGRHCRWSAEPGMDRVAYGVPNRVDRVGALGNAIVPQVAAEIMKAIKQIYG